MLLIPKSKQCPVEVKLVIAFVSARNQHNDSARNHLHATKHCIHVNNTIWLTWIVSCAHMKKTSKDVLLGLMSASAAHRYGEVHPI